MIWMYPWLRTRTAVPIRGVRLALGVLQSHIYTHCSALCFFMNLACFYRLMKQFVVLDVCWCCFVHQRK